MKLLRFFFLYNYNFFTCPPPELRCDPNERRYAFPGYTVPTVCQNDRRPTSREGWKYNHNNVFPFPFCGCHIIIFGIDWNVLRTYSYVFKLQSVRMVGIIPKYAHSKVCDILQWFKLFFIFQNIYVFDQTLTLKVFFTIIPHENILDDFFHYSTFKSENLYIFSKTTNCTLIFYLCNIYTFLFSSLTIISSNIIFWKSVLLFRNVDSYIFCRKTNILRDITVI